MEIAEIAIAISGCALLISFGNLIWSIRSTYIQVRPKIQTHFAVMIMTPPINFGQCAQAIQISATNHGPNEVVLTGVVGMSKRFRGLKFVKQHFVIFASKQWPVEGEKRQVDFGDFPQRVNVGDKRNWFLPIDNRYFDESDMTHFGLTDSFGRTHWVNGKSIAAVRNSCLDHKEKNSAALLETPKTQ